MSVKSCVRRCEAGRGISLRASVFVTAPNIVAISVPRPR